MANPALSRARRATFVKALMRARRGVATAERARDHDAERRARAAVDRAKRALGERGAVWWTDGAPDLNRRMARNTGYAVWYDALAPRGVGG